MRVHCGRDAVVWARRAEVFFSQNCGGLTEDVVRCGRSCAGWLICAAMPIRIVRGAMRLVGMRRYHSLRLQRLRELRAGMCR